MRGFLLFLCLFALLQFSSCGSDHGDSRQNHMDHSEDQLTTPSSEEVLLSLSDIVNMNEREAFIKDAIAANLRADNPHQAKDILMNILYHFDVKSHVTNLVPWFVQESKDAAVLNNFDNGLKGAFLYSYPDDPYSSKLSSTKSITDQLNEKEDLINHPDFNRLSLRDAQDYIELSEAWMLLAPKDEHAASNLIKAANLAKTIPGLSKRSIELYDWVLDKQPNHPKAPQVMFLKAFTLDNDIKDYNAAANAYAAFIKKYPDHEFAEQAQLLMDNLGKSDEELFEIIKHNHQ